MTGKPIAFQGVTIPASDESIRVASVISPIGMDAGGIPILAEIERKYGLIYGPGEDERIIVEDLDSILPDMSEDSIVVVPIDIYFETRVLLPHRFDVCMVAEGHGLVFNGKANLDHPKNLFQ